MKHLEPIVEALKSLTERYGITITDVPERLREKILVATGRECADDFELLLQPLLQNFLRPVRVRAGNKVEEQVIAAIITQTAELEGFSPDLARKIIGVWLEIFKVKPVKSLIKPDETDEFANINKQFEIKDNTRLVTDASVETVFNPFDSVSSVVEPQVADFDGKFDDWESEQVTEFSISDAENQVSMNVESFGTDAENAAGEARRHRQNAGTASKQRKGKSAATKTTPEFEMSTSSQNTTPSKYTIDDAFKQLRSNNFEMASKIMMELARNGNSKAQFHLGEFHLMGTGVELNEDKAKYWFRKAAAQGSFPAKQKLEDLENNNSSSGFFGCFFTIIVVGGALKLLSVLAGL